jgi:general L-amino acid transport system permease protein
VNTLRAAIGGIILASLLGLGVGLARLSRNWLLARLATAYVETFRNVPLLLWLVFAYAALRETLPRLRQSLSLFGDAVLLSNRGIAVLWPRPAATFGALLPWCGIALVTGLAIWFWTRRQAYRHGYEAPTAIGRGTLTALAIALIGFVVTWSTARLPAHAVVDPAAEIAYVDANRNGTWDETESTLAGVRVTWRGTDEETSVLTEIDGSFRVPYQPAEALQVELAAAAPIFWSRPQIQGFNYAGGLILTPEFAALLLGLVIYTAAFIAEVVRAGVLAVPKGQREAAMALGLSEAQTFRLVVLPQALRVIIPPLINQYLNLTKNSSLAIAVGYPDLFSVGLTINNQTGQAIPFVIMIMAMYLTMSLLTSLALNLANRRLALRTP